MKLTAEEIIEKIIENLEPYEFAKIGDDGIIEFENEDDETVELNFGECEMVADEEFTNGEAWRVIHFKEHDVYIRQNGCYNSYESYAEYEDHDYDVVVPFEKTVIDYKKVGE
jgi:hypothetical protein